MMNKEQRLQEAISLGFKKDTIFWNLHYGSKCVQLSEPFTKEQWPNLIWVHATTSWGEPMDVVIYDSNKDQWASLKPPVIKEAKPIVQESIVKLNFKKGDIVKCSCGHKGTITKWPNNDSIEIQGDEITKTVKKSDIVQVISIK